ncbi:uncharacterized protein LOC127137385 [Lathyrus oleraceus]|uniref:uncharacterized protein LOC127137385 n=1 Tax=Pisum sativum TaxID=3888 RepID=UPI0021D17497|nr:uncharacterized protein LOC127137385 [Pisum sativum]
MVNRNQNVDEVVQQIRRDDMASNNNLAAMVERIMARNGVDVGLHRPNYTSPLSEYVLQSKLPARWKVPKFIKFSGDTSESTVEHVERYLIDAREITNNENLRIKYFPSSLMKNSFTWFTILPANSIDTWTYFERLFHEPFYMGQSKISLKELASIKQKFAKSIDDYLNRFRLLKARCFTQVPEHDLVEMAAGDLDYSIRKKLDTQYLRDMAQLTDRVRQVEHLKAEKARAKKNNMKDRIAYVELGDDEPETYGDQVNFDESKIDLAELKQGPHYSFKFLAPSNGKNLVEPKKSNRFPKKTYTFDVTKCDEIIDLLVKDFQMIVPPGAKIPPLEQRKKRGFCKCHNFLGHKTSQCFLFRDLVQSDIRDERLKFRDKAKSPMRIDSGPLHIADAHYTEPSMVNMVEIYEGFGRNAEMIEVVDGFNHGVAEGFTNETIEGFVQQVTKGFNKKCSQQLKPLRVLTKRLLRISTKKLLKVSQRMKLLKVSYK